MQRYVYAIAHGHDGEWEAFSLDFDLAVQGRSFEDVSERLQEAVNAYLETAMQEPEPTRTQLMNRAAPLRVRMLWALRFAFWTMFRKSGSAETTFGFPVSCPA